MFVLWYLHQFFQTHFLIVFFFKFLTWTNLFVYLVMYDVEYAMIAYGSSIN
jgi:hypothetical protein